MKNSIDFENSNLQLIKFAYDVNGNRIVKLKFINKGGFSIQTNGVLQNTDYYSGRFKVYQLSNEQLIEIEKEIVQYIQDFGTKTQKANLKTY